MGEKDKKDIGYVCVLLDETGAGSSRPMTPAGRGGRVELYHRCYLTYYGVYSGGNYAPKLPRRNL